MRKLVLLIGLILLLILSCAIISFIIPPDIQGERIIVVAGRTPLINSEIRFYVLNADGSKGRLAGNANSDEEGIYATGVSAGPRDYILAEAVGGSYADGVNKTRQLADSEKLTSIVSAAVNGTWLTITPLTHMAASRALALAANNTPLDTAVESSNIDVARQYGLISIVWNMPVLPDDDRQIETAGIDERDYTLVLAGISDEAETFGVGTMELADALANDASDGLLDGMDGSTPIDVETLAGSTRRLPTDAGTGGVQKGMDSATVAQGLRTNQANAAMPLQPVQLGINGAGKFYVTSTMLPVAIGGSGYTFQLAAQGGAPPYSCSLAAHNADATLSALPPWLRLGGDCIFSGNVPLLSGGSSMAISPQFTVSMCDSADVCSNLELRITTIEKAPELIPEKNAKCFLGEYCDVKLASAKGGSPQYYYRSDYLGNALNNARPEGTTVDLNGHLIGTPSEKGIFDFGVCVIDSIGASSCGTVTVLVASRNATLFLRKTGSGSGKVYADAYSSDEVYLTGTILSLTAAADDGSEFAGWGGACTGAGAECTLTMDDDKEVEAVFNSRGEQPSDTLSVELTSGSCSVVKGTVSGPVGSYLGVYYSNGGTPVQEINCGSWTPGPDTQYQCTRRNGDPPATGWAASPGGGLVDATVYGPGLSGIKSASANFNCQ
ncbi:MAG: hypothetical protein NT157_05425 [Candidatus Micrarchaeota archaeon]|nr:hypothetical protein [Candidatus Micrarchaeota archaeon]